MSFTQTLNQFSQDSADIENRATSSATQKAHGDRDIVPNILLIGSVGKKKFPYGLYIGDAGIEAASSPLVPQSEDDKHRHTNDNLSIATRDTVHRGLIETLARAFIKHSVGNGSKPFKVEWYVGDPTVEATGAVRSVDIPLTYNGAAENESTQNGASVLTVYCLCATQWKDDGKDPTVIFISFANADPHCSVLCVSFKSWVMSPDGGQRVIRDLIRNGHVLCPQAPEPET